METKRIIFWTGFLVVIGLIVWGLVVSVNKGNRNGLENLGQPAPVSASDHATGPLDAPVTIIEYADFECPACESYYYVVKQLLSSSTVPIRLVYRNFPLPQHTNALPAALAAEAAGLQGKYWEMHDLIFQNHADWTDLGDPKPVFVGYAKDLGLDIGRFDADTASSGLKDFIDNQEAEGVGIGIDATPTFFLNGKAINNPPTYAEFESDIEAAASGSGR